MNKNIIFFTLAINIFNVYCSEPHQKKINIDADIILICVSGDIFAEVKIDNHTNETLKLNKFNIGVNGYLFANSFQVIDLTSNQTVAYSGVMPDLILNENSYEIIEPNNFVTKWYNVTKLYSLDQNLTYSIKFNSGSYYHEGGLPLILINSIKKKITCKNTNPLFQLQQ